MTKQLNLLGTGQIIPTALHTEMERSYLEYAMSVIVGRALPDARDGLKPVHRRILYAMHELGLTPDRPYRKCARVVGDVLGKYHPHGDQSVYDALVRLVQDFSTRYPLLDGHGNFGSVDNDPPAAMRYTETRLAPVAHQAMLDEIDGATVDFTDNFDSSQEEPVVLPAQLPILLLNGCSGIAVGMATNVPPHNLGEIVNGLIALIDKPELPDEKLWQLIPGPDFPTGGEIVETQGIKDAYSSGRGIIKVRGVAKVETLYLRQKKRRKERTAIIVTELPYQVNKAGWIEKVAHLVNNSKLEGIADIRDESDRTGMRVVMELKKDASAKVVLQKLARQTAFQSNFGAIMLALVNNKPVQLSLRQLLEEFLVFRESTLRKQYSNELEKTQQRLHLVSGLLVALNNIDTIVDILRNAPDGTTAKASLTEDLGISEAQADSILGMPMRRLTGLEKQKLETEQAELEQRISQLETLLGDRHELMKTLKKELRSLKRKYGDERRTQILQQVIAPEVKQPTKAKNVKNAENKATKSQKIEPPSSLFKIERAERAELTITNEGHIYWQNPDPTNQITTSALKKGEEFVTQHQLIGNHDKIIFAADSGRAYPIAIADIPSKLESQNATTYSFLSSAAQREANQTIAHFFLPTENEPFDVILLTEKGILKRLKGSELQSIGNRGLVLIKLKDRDRLKYLNLVRENQEIAIATNGGRILRFPVNNEQIPVMGRNAQGNQALRLRYGEELVSCVTLSDRDNLLLITELGYGKQLDVNAIRLAKRGDIGTQAINFNNKEDRLASVTVAKAGKDAIITTNTDRRLSLAINDVEVLPRDSQGTKIVKLKSEETINNIYLQC
ncbi:DNA topoisomerase 4 subunit A [Hyella patelloides LEGE 07179]|uniref:DNA topoisomerase (ATP-hydrolyzing) n=1 Tax=Hyella patelloides LEGE 07179 TaxID=945734 RepID=A0A563VPI1_9CYAN|nr:DNA topoisomerase (ATP-hydrolyzing) [Hyella patelloides]VEP13289.1 DNA topoisomerase 4 subunit A [Hyella patelloides LEGE 07179]